jgi:hypothetical protein
MKKGRITPDGSCGPVIEPDNGRVCDLKPHIIDCHCLECTKPINGHIRYYRCSDCLHVYNSRISFHESKSGKAYSINGTIQEDTRDSVCEPNGTTHDLISDDTSDFHE